MMRFRHRPVVGLVSLCAFASSGVAAADTSHAGWPRIDGVLRMHKRDQSSTLHGTRRSDELLGGHGNDTLAGRGGPDVIWGDYKPSGQPNSQVDRIIGGGGGDYIYASHGLNFILGGTGNDIIHAHFGHGSINCGPGYDTVFISRRGQAGWQLHNCERVSHKTLGY